MWLSTERLEGYINKQIIDCNITFLIFSFWSGKGKKKSPLVTNASIMYIFLWIIPYYHKLKLSVSTIRKIHQHNVVLEYEDLKHFPGRD